MRRLVLLAVPALLWACPEPAAPPRPTQPETFTPKAAPETATATASAALEAMFSVSSDVPEVVARIDRTTEMSKAAFAKQLERMKLQLKAVGAPEGLSAREVHQSAIDQLVNGALLDVFAKSLGVQVDPKLVDTRDQQIAARAKEDAAFRGLLEQAGITPEVRRIDAERFVLKAGVESKLAERLITRTSTSLLDYYQKHPEEFREKAGRELWRISIKLDPTMNEEQRKATRNKAESIRSRAVANPKEFESLARESSEGGMAQGGGYLGYVSTGSLPRDVEDLVNSAKPGQILDLVSDPSGFYVFKVGAERKERIIPFGEVKQRIFDQTMRWRVVKELDLEISKLRETRVEWLYQPK